MQALGGVNLSTLDRSAAGLAATLSGAVATVLGGCSTGSGDARR